MNPAETKTQPEETQKNKITFRNLAEAKAYQEWKNEVPAHLRSVVEGAMLGKKTGIGKEFTPLLGQFLSSLQDLLHNPGMDADAPDTDPRVKNQLKKIRKIAMDEKSFMDVIGLLRDPDTGFKQKLQWYTAQIEPRLKWLQQQDARPSEPPSELAPPDPQDELEPSMDEMEEGKEGPSDGIYEVAPFYGGYYRGHIYEEWETAGLKWKKGQRKLEECHAQPEFEEGTVRVMRGKFKAGIFQPIDLPYGFAIDPSSVDPAGTKTVFHRDRDGIWYCKADFATADEFGQESESGVEPQNAAASPTDSSTMEFKIGKLKKPSQAAARATTQGNSVNAARPVAQDNSTQDAIPAETPASALPADVTQKIADAKTAKLPGISKARILCGFVKNHLEYSNDSSCNGLYRANPSQYFTAIWQNKKADCDVANTFAAEVLRQSGLKVRMIAGHYVKSATKTGTALLHGGTGHAWLEVFDEQKKTWTRMDATPKGDPNLDEEEQEEDLQDTSEGDYGEQEAEVMGDDELAKLLEDLEKDAQKPPPESPEVRFANEAGCTPQEARLVLQKIAALRQLKDDRGRNILQQSKNAWHEVVKKNHKEKIVYTGPVRMHEGDDLVDVATAAIDIRTKEFNPSGFEKPAKKIEIQKYFGGFEVYLAADLSGSMDETDARTGQKKADAQRDCAFLFVDGIMGNALEVKKNMRNLKSPLPVKVSLTVFGARTEVVLPLTDQWGPREQIRLYRALDTMAGGGTPDDSALNMIRRQIAESKAEEAAATRKSGIGATGDPRKGPHGSPLGGAQGSPEKNAQGEMHRFVAVFADGGSNNAPTVRSLIQAMRDEGTVVHGFGITQSGRAMEAVYAPDAVTVEDPSKLAEVGLATLVKTIKKWYGI